jgi:protein-S-isoprenylcysteine O-methyltransferase Ste14
MKGLIVVRVLEFLLVGTFAFWISLVFIPHCFLSLDNLWFHVELGLIRWAGIPIFCGGLILVFPSATLLVTRGRGTPNPLDPPKQLVKDGFYKHTRNPMIVGFYLMLAGESIYFESLGIFIYLILAIITGHLYIVFIEEKRLEKKYGEEYKIYKQMVPRWFPR